MITIKDTKDSEKDIPKRIKIKLYDGFNTICPWVCPTCEKPTFMKRCPYCGQLIYYRR